MINSIKYFEEECISYFEKLEDNFMKEPLKLAEYVVGLTEELHQRSRIKKLAKASIFWIGFLVWKKKNELQKMRWPECLQRPSRLPTAVAEKRPA